MRPEDVGKGQMENRRERRWLMENIIPLDANVEGAVINK